MGDIKKHKTIYEFDQGEKSCSDYLKLCDCMQEGTGTARAKMHFWNAFVEKKVVPIPTSLYIELILGLDRDKWILKEKLSWFHDFCFNRSRWIEYFLINVNRIFFFAILILINVDIRRSYYSLYEIEIFTGFQLRFWAYTHFILILYLSTSLNITLVIVLKVILLTFNRFQLKFV